MRIRSHLAVATALVLVLSAAAALPACAGGPPSFSFQSPDTRSKGGASDPVMVVHAFLCHEPTDAAVIAHAEGVVNGERKTIPLKLESTKATGVYNVTRQWPENGDWVLVFTVERGGPTTALVTLGARGNPTFDGSGTVGAPVSASTVRTISGKAKPADIETVLMAKRSR